MKLLLTFVFSSVNIRLMLKIRLQRVGRKNDASFRVVVIESQRGPKAGNALEVLGFYDPKKNVIEIKGDRVTHWISVGAQASDTVHNLLVKQKIIKGEKINVLPKKSPIKKEGETKEGGEKDKPAVAIDSDEAKPADVKNPPTGRQGSGEEKEKQEEETKKEESKEKTEETKPADTKSSDETKTDPDENSGEAKKEDEKKS